MASFLFNGGSHDGQEVDIPGEPPEELPLPARTPGMKKVEVYVLRNNAFHFDRYGVPPMSATDASADAEMWAICEQLGPVLDRLEKYCQRRGGYCPLRVGQWDITRSDE